MHHFSISRLSSLPDVGGPALQKTCKQNRCVLEWLECWSGKLFRAACTNYCTIHCCSLFTCWVM